MAIAALAIGNMSTAALYVSSFHVEVFSDPTYTTLVDSQACAAIKDSSGNWIQSQMIGIHGLVRGATYYVQAGPVSPGGVANFSRFSIVAGALTIPACTYTGTFTATSAGITYDITPASVPVDLDHFEAIWTKDGSSPSNSSLENSWSGQALANGFIHIFAGGSPGQVIHLFFRAVSTSGGYQNWVAVDNRTVASSSSGSVSAAGIFYADGTSVEALKPGEAGADVTGANVSQDTSAVNGINSGHIADTAVSIGFVGKWWRTSSGAFFPPGGGELPYAPMFTTHDASINYNIFTYNTFVGSIASPSFAAFGPNFDGKWIYVRWTGYFTCTTTGSHAFGTNSDDGANLYVNGVKLVNDLNGGHGANSNLTPQHSGTITLTAGDVYEIIVEYTNNAGGAGIQCVYTPPGTSGWQILNLGTAYKSATFTQYADGTTVDALQPAAAGADVTAVNVSADTASVGGRAAGDITSTILSGGGTDYAHTGNINQPQNANNLLLRGTFEDGSTGTWSANGGVVSVTGQSFTKAMKVTVRDTIEGNVFQVTEGQRIYISGYVNTLGITALEGYTTSLGINCHKADGTPTWLLITSVPAHSDWVEVSGFVTIPSGYIQAQGYIGIDSVDFSANPFAEVAALFITKTAVVDFSEPTHVNKNAGNIPYASGATIESLKPAQVGADVTGSNTANNTNNVGSVPASTISQVVPSGFKLFINSGSRSYSIQAI